MPFETKSGGYMDDVDAEVLAAKWCRREDYASGEVIVLAWTIHCPIFPEAKDILWSIGMESSKEWEIENGGEKLVYVGTGKPVFRDNSTYGRLLIRVNDLVPADFAKRGLPENAGIWAKTIWHLMREKADFGAGVGTKEHLMPTAFVGEKASKAPVAAPGKLQADLVKLAQEAKQLDEFQTKALALIRKANLKKPDIDAVRADVLNEEGFWTRHHGS